MANSNRFMHPRNMYKAKPPNFTELAEKYSEFRKHCTTDCAGKVFVNFKEPEAVRSLTRALLLDNFGLDVELPSDSLVPRIPQRLNYILWIEDILSDNESVNTMPENRTEAHRSITGIDIGTGASCVYPLLAAKQCDWNFIATDKDPEAVSCAKRNVVQNKLETKIRVIQVEEKTAICGALSVADSAKQTFDFIMCNPPFYDTSEVADHESGFLRCCTFVDYSENESASNRKKARPNPHSNTIAKQSEVCAEGGEYVFIARIIDDSAILRNQIRVYTSMVGKKANLGPLKAKLRSVGVASMCQTIFCQGKTQRWALAWTFDPKIKLNRTEPSQKNKKNPSHRLDFPICMPKTEAATSKLLSMLDEIKVLHKRIQPNATSLDCQETMSRDGINGSCSTLPSLPSSDVVNQFSRFECECYENTWSNQRRKRRATKNQRSVEEQPDGKLTAFENGHTGSADLCNGSNSSNGVSKKSGFDAVAKKEINTCDSHQANGAASSSCPSVASNNPQTQNREPLLKFTASVAAADDGRVFANLDWIDGENKDHLHQILQYMRNSLASTEVNGKSG